MRQQQGEGGENPPGMIDGMFTELDLSAVNGRAVIDAEDSEKPEEEDKDKILTPRRGDSV